METEKNNNSRLADSYNHRVWSCVTKLLGMSFYKVFFSFTKSQYWTLLSVYNDFFFLEKMYKNHFSPGCAFDCIFLQFELQNQLQS